jgi:hypothetical protein
MGFPYAAPWEQTPQLGRHSAAPNFRPQGLLTACRLSQGDGRQAREPASRRPKTVAFSLPTLPVRFRRQLRLTFVRPNPATPPCCRLVIRLLVPAPDPALREKPIPAQVFRCLRSRPNNLPALIEALSEKQKV